MIAKPVRSVSTFQDGGARNDQTYYKAERLYDDNRLKSGFFFMYLWPQVSTPFLPLIFKAGVIASGVCLLG
jgi:hypothetical protein